ncbi:unnamed protein product, partial [Schistosoma mattheei]
MKLEQQLGQNNMNSLNIVVSQCNNNSNISDSLLNNYPYPYTQHHQQQHHPYEHHQHNSNSPVFLHIVRTCDIVNDPKLMKSIIETKTTGHLVE